MLRFTRAGLSFAFAARIPPQHWRGLGLRRIMGSSRSPDAGRPPTGRPALDGIASPDALRARRLALLVVLVVPQVGLEPTTDGLSNILVVAVSLLVHVSTLLSTWQTMPALPPAPVMPALPVLPAPGPSQFLSFNGESALSEDHANDTEPSPAFTADSTRLGRRTHKLGNEHEGGWLQ